MLKFFDTFIDVFLNWATLMLLTAAAFTMFRLSGLRLFRFFGAYRFFSLLDLFLCSHDASPFLMLFIWLKIVYGFDWHKLIEACEGGLDSTVS